MEKNSLTSRIIIFGSSGFLGSELAKIYQEDTDEDVYLFSRYAKSKNLVGLSESPSAKEISNVITSYDPTHIFNMVGSYDNKLREDFSSNVSFVKNLIEGLCIAKSSAKLLLIGSASEYGNSNCDDGISEVDMLNPQNIYGLTKSIQSYLFKYYISSGVYSNIVLAKLFNIYGRGAPRKLIIGNLYHQIKMYKIGKIKRIKLGSLNAERDYLSIREVLLELMFLMRFGEPGEIYNIGSGRLISLKDLVSNIMRSEGLDMSLIDIEEFELSVIYKSYANINKLMQLKARYL